MLTLLHMGYIKILTDEILLEMRRIFMKTAQILLGLGAGVATGLGVAFNES